MSLQKIVLYFVFTFLVFSCVHTERRLERFTFYIRNNCNYQVTCAFQMSGGYTKFSNINYNETFGEGCYVRKQHFEKFEETKKKFILNANEKIIIKYSPFNEQVISIQDFIKMSEEQMGYAAESSWTYILCK